MVLEEAEMPSISAVIVENLTEMVWMAGLHAREDCVWWRGSGQLGVSATDVPPVVVTWNFLTLIYQPGCKLSWSMVLGATSSQKEHFESRSICDLGATGQATRADQEPDRNPLPLKNSSAISVGGSRGSALGWLAMPEVAEREK